MASDEDLLPLSALQHMLYCERQAALIHVAQLWADNALTVGGSRLHETVDSGMRENRGEIRIRRSVPLRSERMRLIGKADVVEFHRVDAGPGTSLPGVGGKWVPYPVEYKRGKPKAHQADEVQLCAQAMCLEEMLGVPIPEGALFYGRRQRRSVISLEETLRELVLDTAQRMHAIIDVGVLPVRMRDRRCDRCSLVEICMPLSSSVSAVAYLENGLAGGA